MLATFKKLVRPIPHIVFDPLLTFLPIELVLLLPLFPAVQELAFEASGLWENLEPALVEAFDGLVHLDCLRISNSSKDVLDPRWAAWSPSVRVTEVSVDNLTADAWMCVTALAGKAEELVLHVWGESVEEPPTNLNLLPRLSILTIKASASVITRVLQGHLPDRNPTLSILDLRPPDGHLIEIPTPLLSPSIIITLLSRPTVPLLDVERETDYQLHGPDQRSIPTTSTWSPLTGRPSEVVARHPAQALYRS